MNVIFFHSHTFLTKEIKNALLKRTDLTPYILQVPQYPDTSSVETLISQLEHLFPALIFTINDAGYDYQGTLQAKLISKGCYLVNWYHDYPLYDEIFHKRKMVPQKERFDFISEDSFVNELQNRSLNCGFLPLATDPQFFPPDTATQPIRDISFVGNSSSIFIDSVVTEKQAQEIEKLMPLLSRLKKEYYADPTFNIREYLIDHYCEWQGKTNLPKEELLFILEWLCGYFYRKDFIIHLSKTYQKKFMCFGDADWQHFIDPSLVSTEACYYTTLHEVYKSSRINLNINRIQIRTAFTQRIFDCAACEAFILTDKRKHNDTFFITQGAKKELVQFSSFNECRALIDYYLQHEDERKMISERARKKVLLYHTYDNRIDSILTKCRDLWKI